MSDAGYTLDGLLRLRSHEVDLAEAELARREAELAEHSRLSASLLAEREDERGRVSAAHEALLEKRPLRVGDFQQLGRFTDQRLTELRRLDAALTACEHAISAGQSAVKAAQTTLGDRIKARELVLGHKEEWSEKRRTTQSRIEDDDLAAATAGRRRD